MTDPTRENNQTEFETCYHAPRLLGAYSRTHDRGPAVAKGHVNQFEGLEPRFQRRFELGVKPAMPEEAPLRENRLARCANCRMRRFLRYARGRSRGSDSLLRFSPTVVVLPPTTMSGTFCRSTITRTSAARAKVIHGDWEPDLLPPIRETLSLPAARPSPSALNYRKKPNSRPPFSRAGGGKFRPKPQAKLI